MSHVARLVIGNETSRPRTVWVEPWGEDYTLMPGEKLEVVARSDQETPWFHVVEHDDGTAAWIDGQGSGDFDVLQDGKKIECGHRREEARDAGLPM